MTKKTYSRYVKLIKTRHWTETDIISFRKMLLCNLKWKGTECGFDGRSNRMLAEELLALFRKAGKHRITREQTEKGLNWLERSCFNSKGEIRNSKSRPFERWDCVRLKQMLPKFSHWEFYDVHPVYNNFGELNHFAPVYALHTRDKQEFIYVADPLGFERGCHALAVA